MFTCFGFSSTEFRRSTAIFAVAVLVLTYVYPRPARAQALEFTAEELVLGLLFGEGPVASHFPEVWQDPQVVAYRGQLAANLEAQTAVNYARSLVLETIESKNPSFYSDFEAGVRSGDQVKVRTALTEAGTLIGETTQEVFDEHPELITSKEFDFSLLPGHGPPTYLYLYFVYAFFLFIVLVLIVILAILLVIPVAGMSDEHSQLLQDTYVDLIATRLNS